ncbi:hypothetical protein QD712_01265 [Streptomyces acidiscabies]|uniref:hypothetical protein n=1 Tax=Streptomyces acidiscabies TaxID=42234 RepID=UPI0030D2FFCE
MADSADADLLLFRWEGNRDRYGTGIAASAHSCGETRAEELRLLLAPLLRVEGAQSRRSSVVRCFDPATGEAVVVHRRPALDARGRESTVSRVLVGDPALLTARDSVTLADQHWEWLGVPDDVSGKLERVPTDAVRGQFAEAFPRYLNNVAYIRTPLEVAVAQLIRTPGHRLTFLRREVQSLEKASYAPLLIWGVCAMLGEWLGDTSLTYASFDTQADARLRLVCVPEWPRSAVGGVGVERISFAQAPRDEARQVAARLVELFLAEPERPEALAAVLRGCPGPGDMGAGERLDRLIGGLVGGGGEVRAAPGTETRSEVVPGQGPEVLSEVVSEAVPEVPAAPEPVPVVPVIPVAPAPEPTPVSPLVIPVPSVVPVVPLVVRAAPVDPPHPSPPDPLPPVAAYVPVDPLPVMPVVPVVPPLPKSYDHPAPQLPAPEPPSRADRHLPHRTRRLGRLVKYSSPEWWRQRPTREAPGPLLTRLTGLDRLSDGTLCGELARPDLSPRAAQEILRALERRTRWRTFAEAVALAGTVFGHGMFLRSEWRTALAEEDTRHGGVAGAVRMFRWAVLPYLGRPELAARVTGMLESLAHRQPPEVREFWRRALFEQDPAPELPAVLWRELARTRPWEERVPVPDELSPIIEFDHPAPDPADHVPPQSYPVTTPASPLAPPATRTTHRTPSPPDDTAKFVTIALALLTLFVLLILLLNR